MPFRIFCHYGRTCDLSKNPKAGQRRYRYFSNLEDARICFQNLYDEKTKKGYNPLQLLSSNIGSEAAQALRLAALGSSPSPSSTGQPENSTLHPEIQRLVRLLYEEASNAITASVNAKITSHGIETALGVLTKRQVEAGEEILLKKIKTELESRSPRRQQLEKFSSEFLSIVPHRIGHSAAERAGAVIDSMAKLEQKLELLQLMKDMLSLISDGGIGNVIDMQYKALHTNLVPLEKNSSTWNDVKNFVLGTQTTNTNSADISSIFAIRRPQEKLYSAIGNLQLQFHGSRACNFVGLLSRGILMPKIVVSRGGGRTDAGLLGNGIYFSDSFTTAAQYAHPNAEGSRFVLANRVALGRCKDYTETQIGMSKPPFGYHSVHGVSQQTNPSSAFKDNEFVVFDPSQQVQEFLVEFKTIQSNEPVVKVSYPPEQLPNSFFDAKSSISQSSVPFSTPIPTQTFSSPVTSSFAPQPTPALATFSSATNTQNTMQDEEEKYRKMFANDRNNYALQNPYLNLVDVMQNVASFNYQALSNEENSWPSLLTKFSKPLRIGAPSICNSQNKFNENWEAFTESQFQGLNWENLFVAGGAVLSCLQPDFSTSVELGNPFHSSDIDIFVYGLSQFEANEKLRHIYETVKQNTNGSATMIRSKHAITILGEYPYRHTQIILRIYKSPAEILMGFDIDCCCVGFNGKQVFALPRARRALTKQFNLVDLSRRSLTYEIRLHKYSKRGFRVKVPTLQMNRVDKNLYHRRVGEVSGLAKLLIFNNIQVTGTAAVRPRGTVAAGITPVGNPTQPSDSDYSDVTIPWGPNWFIAQILNSISNQNKKTAFVAGASSGIPSHTFVSDLQGILQGRRNENCLCSLCKGGNPPRSSDDTSSPLKWLTENPGRQILTGSFHPVQDNEWETDAYKSWSEIPGTFFRPVSVGGVSKVRKSVAPKKARTAKPGYGQFVAFTSEHQPQSGSSFGSTGTQNTGGFGSPTTPALPGGFGVSTPAPHQPWGAPVQPPGAAFGSSFVASTPAPRQPWGAPAQPQSGSAFGSTGVQITGGFGSLSAAPGGENVVFGKTEGLGKILEPRPPTSVSMSNFAETIQPQSDISKLLLLVSQLCRDGLLSEEEKSSIKNLIIRRNATVISALEVFEIERDFHELADSFRRICRFNS
eukprot:CAMPEP_0117004946 /NCGR_PEP_ID=MMETSP0472-20121206/5747_1 /TAXON_ID=693140 ORGANISM="Tiarina fusus, Strain LIS" /NCGR_SAMPLE_ID=MMETSP0472 /ASSEMBLY_ACC=CAM_ASM_000603 /LENGTH=1154 /DNA_ID=CAMNT_0004706065 /DNA_START=652 /DNA_END=4116 /DNA_ORIENTATION=-